MRRNKMENMFWIGFAGFALAAEWYFKNAGEHAE